MGSNSYGPYAGTGGGSQPYAEAYSVVPKVLAIDKRNKNVYKVNKGYFRNPTAVNIENSNAYGKIIVGNKSAHGTMTYVLDINGNMIVGKRVNPYNSSSRAPHPTLIGGKNPKVKCAGMITFSKGKIVSIDNDSGHFRPNIKSMKKVYGYLEKLHSERPDLFSSKFKWRK